MLIMVQALFQAFRIMGVKGRGGVGCGGVGCGWGDNKLVLF